MNAGVVTSWISRSAGGLFQSVRSLSQALACQPGVSVQVFGCCDECSEADAPAWQPLVPRTFPCVGPRQFGFSPALNRAVREDDCDLVHTHGIWLAHAMAPLAWHRRTGRPLVVSPRGMLDPWILQRSPWKKRFACWLYVTEHLNQAACLHALCQSEAESMRAYGLRNPICTIPNGIDLPSLAADRLSALMCPLKSAKTNGRKVVLFLGRIHPKKGLANLVRAWGSLGAERQEWILAIAGWDELGYEAELKQLATKLNLSWLDLRNPSLDQQPVAIKESVSVLFVGPQFGDDKSACYWNSDAFVLPSFSEGLPMAVLEAWSFGKPVLMTPTCNIPQGFAAGAALRIATEPQSIRQGLHVLFSMPEADRQAMGQRGLKLVLERFTWPKIAQDMHAVYQWVLGGGAKPDSVESR